MKYIHLILLLCPFALSAQGRPEPGANCHGVITATLASGSEHPHFARCASSAAPYIARALGDAATESDPVRLAWLGKFAYYIRDPGLFDAALELSMRSGARPQAKVLGLLIGLRQVGETISFHTEELPFQRPISEHCAEVVFLTFGANRMWVQRDLDPSAESRLREAADALSAAPESSLMVRRFADCALLLLPDPADEDTHEEPEPFDELRLN